MSKKGTDIVAYLTFVGWIISFLLGTRTESKFHLNQALVLVLANIVWGLISRVLIFIPIIGWIVMAIGNVCLLVLWLLGLIHAIRGEEKPIPLLGNLVILG